mmetsp:Transcript_17113/g.57424  ORF Transcript_17113/g.57424 Transcript_17113/m.57424 type:complete len:225 (-) Transcript_17113:191-865(-)
MARGTNRCTHQGHGLHNGYDRRGRALEQRDPRPRGPRERHRLLRPVPRPRPGAGALRRPLRRGRAVPVAGAIRHPRIVLRRGARLPPGHAPGAGARRGEDGALRREPEARAGQVRAALGDCRRAGRHPAAGGCGRDGGRSGTSRRVRAVARRADAARRAGRVTARGRRPARDRTRRPLRGRPRSGTGQQQSPRSVLSLEPAVVPSEPHLHSTVQLHLQRRTAKP